MIISISLLLADYPAWRIEFCFESEPRVADLSANQAFSMHSSSIRSNLFNVMAASRALQNVVSTKADRQAQALIQLSCTSPSPCSEKDSLLITLTTLHRRLGRVYSIALVKARTQGLGRLGCQPIMRVGTPGVARDTCQRSWDSTLYGLARPDHPVQWANLKIGLTHSW